MSEIKFSRDQALSFGWQTMKANLVFFIVLLLILGFINVIPNMATQLAQRSGSSGHPNLALMGFAGILQLAFALLGMIMQIGVMKICLKFIDGGKPDYMELFSHYRYFLFFLVGSILYGLIVFGGFLLLIVPGIIWSIKYGFTIYLIIDREMNPIDAIKKSAVMTDGVKGQLFVFYIILALINLAGALCLLVGLFVTIPTSMVAMAYVYRQLLASAEPAPAPNPAPAL
jgi:uncharacterized membrane protein